LFLFSINTCKVSEKNYTSIKMGGENLKITDNNLIIEMKNTNPAALEYAIDVYGKLVYTVIYNVLNTISDKSCIQECVSDTFTAIWYNIEAFNCEKASFKTWITAIAKYKAIDYKKKYIKSSNVKQLKDDTVIDMHNSENLIIERENKEELLSAIEELGKLDCEIFIRKYFLDESIDAIATRLGLTRQAVDNRLWRGRKKLKNKLCFIRKELIL
jgi:RNA polymerase sigma-70 factor (ECF subfamily)